LTRRLKRIIISIISILILIPLLLTACTRESLSAETIIHEEYNGIDLKTLGYYDIEVDLDYEGKSYRAKQSIRYVNHRADVLEELYFHLYPNAFKSIDSLPILFKDSIDTSTFDEGYIEILTIKGDNGELAYELLGEDDTILKISLDKPLAEGQVLDIHMEYVGKLPSPMDRFGYGDRVINLGNWYPILCVHDENGWNTDPYYDIGDPFYSDIANYRVKVITDEDVVIASSGNILWEEIVDGKKTYEIEGKLIRDFALVASKDFKIAEDQVDGTVIKLYYLEHIPDMVDNSLRYSKRSLKLFNKLFGQYPYGYYSVVMTEFPSGMEYPGIVFISHDYFKNAQADLLEQVIVHETAHQWWYGLVGSNQIREAWLDEALASYSETIYYREVYSKEKAKEYFDYNVKLGYEYGKNFLLEGDRVLRPLGEFKGWEDYSILVYLKGALFIDDIRENYGIEALYDILNSYFEEYKFRIATTEDFIRVCEEVTGSSFDYLVEKWLY